MANDLQQVINSAFGLSLAQFAARSLPASVGYPFAKFLGEQIASQSSLKMVRAARANQWVVQGCRPGKDALDELVRENFRHSARTIFDLYHFINNPKAAGRRIIINATTSQLIQRPEFDGPGLVIAGLHLSGFDLCLQWLGQMGFKPLVLTIPNPRGGRQVEYDLRSKSGLKLLPGSMVAMRQALRHLQQGGIVLTGIDRPIAEPGCRPRFFGQPAALPTHHIFLALKARVPVMLMAANLQEDEKYHVLTSDLIEMDSHPNHEIETTQNAEKVLNTAEGFLRLVPEQWSMPLPVWPELLDRVP